MVKKCSRCKGRNTSLMRTCSRCRNALKVQRVEKIMQSIRAKQQAVGSG